MATLSYYVCCCYLNLVRSFEPFYGNNLSRLHAFCQTKLFLKLNWKFEVVKWKNLVPHTNQTILLLFVKKDSNESVKLFKLKFNWSVVAFVLKYLFKTVIIKDYSKSKMSQT